MKQTFIIQEKPIAKQRPRFNGNHAYTPQKTVSYENIVSWSYKLAHKEKLNGSLKMCLKFNFKIPKSRKDVKVGDYYSQKPDIDNLCKAIQDSLNGIAYDDDSQIVILESVKVWNTIDYTEVTIEEIGER